MKHYLKYPDIVLCHVSHGGDIVLVFFGPFRADRPRDSHIKMRQNMGISSILLGFT